MHLKFLPFTNDTISAAIVERNLQVCDHSLVEVCTHGGSFETAAWLFTFDPEERSMPADYMFLVHNK